MKPDAAELRIRSPREDEAAEIAAAVQASLRELEPWMPWATAGYDDAGALAWIRGETGDAHRFLMYVGDQVVGTCGLNGVSEENRSANLGYWVRSGQVGHGFATAATLLLARTAFDDVGLHRLEIVMSTRNHASRRVAEKAGATHEGIIRGALRLHGEFHDAHIWSLLATDR